MKTKYIKNENGMVLAWVLVVLVLLSIISVSIMSVYSSDYGSSTYQANKTQAHYLARAGAEAVADYIVDNPNSLSAVQIDNLINSISSVPKSNQTKIDNTDRGYFEVKIEQSGNKVNIISTGTVGNVKETDTMVIEKSAALPNFTYAVFSDGPISMIQGSHISGNVGTNSSSTTNLYMDGNPRIWGTYFMGPGASVPGDLDTVKGKYPTFLTGPTPAPSPTPTPSPYVAPVKVSKISQSQVNSDPIFTVYPTPTPVPANDGSITVGWSASEPPVTITTTKNYTGGVIVKKDGLTINGPVSGNMTVEAENLSVQSVGQVHINHYGSGTLMLFVDNLLSLTASTVMDVNFYGSGDVVILTKNMTLDAGHIKVKRYGAATGRLNIFVKSTLTLKSDSSINYDNDPNWASLLYNNGAADVTLGGNLHLNTHLEIWGSGALSVSNGTNVKGDIIYGGNSLTFDGGTDAVSRLIYAPKAAILLDAGTNITGCVIGKTVSMEGAALVTFKAPTINPGDPINNNFGAVSYKRVQWY